MEESLYEKEFNIFNFDYNSCVNIYSVTKFLKISFRNSGIIAIIIIISGTVFIEAKFAGEEK